MPRKNTQTLDPLESFAKLWQNQPGLPPIDTELEEDFCDGVGKYTVLWQIGCGEFGIVHTCSSGVSHRDDAGSASSHEELAMKSINKTEVSSLARQPHALGLLSPSQRARGSHTTARPNDARRRSDGFHSRAVRCAALTTAGDGRTTPP